MTVTPDPLLGKLLVLDSPDGDSYTTSRFIEKINKWLYRMEPCSPRTGESLSFGDFIIDLRLVALDPSEESIPPARIFDSWEKLKSEMDEPVQPASVVKLVRPRPPEDDSKN